jgi:hypothetical protein
MRSARLETCNKREKGDFRRPPQIDMENVLKSPELPGLFNLVSPHSFHSYFAEVLFLWAHHQVHHSSEEFNLVVGLRQSVLQQWCSFVSAVAYAYKKRSARIPSGVTPPLLRLMNLISKGETDTFRTLHILPASGFLFVNFSFASTFFLIPSTPHFTPLYVAYPGSKARFNYLPTLESHTALVTRESHLRRFELLFMRMIFSFFFFLLYFLLLTHSLESEIMLSYLSIVFCSSE